MDIIRSAGVASIAGALLWFTAAMPASAQSGWVSGAPLSTQWTVGADGQTYVGVWVHAPAQAVAHRRRPAMAVSLVIDTSGSMAGAKIQQARMAASSLVESLHDGDVVSIYGFNTSVTEIAPPVVLTATARAHLLAQIQRLYAVGGTNLYGGMQAAVRRMAEAPPSHRVRRVFVISDGRANVGPSDPGSLSNVAAGATEFGTQITTIGVGYDYDQTTLMAMAVRSSGRVYHLSQPQQMANILRTELNLLARSVAVNASLEIVPAPGVTILEATSLGSSLHNGSLRVPLGVIHAGQRREILFRARIDTRRLGRHPLAHARLSYRSPHDETRQHAETQLEYAVSRNASAAARSRQPLVAAMVENHRASQAQERAAALLRQGQQAQAAAQLAQAQRRLAAAAAESPAGSAPARQLQRRSQALERAHRQALEANTPAAQQRRSYDFADEASEAQGY